MPPLPTSASSRQEASETLLAARESSRGGKRWPGRRGSQPRPAALGLAAGRSRARPSRALTGSRFSPGTQPENWEQGAGGQPAAVGCGAGQSELGGGRGRGVRQGRLPSHLRSPLSPTGRRSGRCLVLENNQAQQGERISRL